VSGYTKLFSSILYSTIWQAPDNVRLVWITMLAMKDRDGLVEASIPGLAKTAGQTIAQTEDALAVLMAPDPYSRTPDNEGRRIVTIDGGWSVLNHDTYRNKGNADEERAKTAARVARYRARKKDVTVTAGNALSRPVTTSDPDPEADPDTDRKDSMCPPAAGHVVSTKKGQGLPERAWAGADYLREKILAKQPGNVIAAKPWTDAKTGTRRKWAEMIDKLERLGHGRTYDEIALTVRWLFEEQRGDKYDLVVLSPAALLEKWDRIQARRSAPSRASSEPLNEFTDYE
jgi:hypothetical protein